MLSLDSAFKSSTLITYLDQFPLFTGKRLNYDDWKVVVGMMLDKTHTSAEGRATITDIKAGMNSKRTRFTWTHLSVFTDNY